VKIFKQNLGNADLRFAFGKALYKHVYVETPEAVEQSPERQFAEKCLAFYCEEIERIQKSVLFFLWICHEKVLPFPRDVSQLIARTAWNAREEAYRKN
jgi:hypothetical protein